MFGIFPIALFLCGFAAARSDFPAFLMENEDITNEADNSVGKLFTAPLDLGEIPCHIDVKITKQLIGKCVRRATGSEACVAGSYVHPFHHECTNMER